MKPEYAPKTTAAKLGWLVEEMGEAQAAIGKTLRHGLGSFNPEPGSDRELNGDWILRELRDVEHAIVLAREAICVEMQAVDGNERSQDASPPRDCFLRKR